MGTADVGVQGKGNAGPGIYGASVSGPGGQFVGSTTGRAPIAIGILATAPTGSGAASGDIYWDGAKLWIYNGTGWKYLTPT